MAENKKPEGLVYKNHPLRRVDNFIYYGSMADKYIVLLQILDTVKEQDMDVAKRVSVQLQLTDPDLKSRDRVVKKSEKDSLYAAMDVGCIWLERALAGKLCRRRRSHPGGGRCCRRRRRDPVSRRLDHRVVPARRAPDPAPRCTSRIRDRTGPVRPDAIERCKRCR